MKTRTAAQIALAVLAIMAVLAIADHALAQARMPFGIGGSEGAATPPTNAIAAYILARQSEFFRTMTAAVRALATEPGRIWQLLGISLGYGVFHAAGPGHGKAVISSYIVADAQALRRGFALALAAAVLQGLVAIALVMVLAKLLGLTAIGMTAATQYIETASYVAIVAFGLWLIFRKGRSFIASFAPAGTPVEADCDHVHLPPPEVARTLTWRETAGVVVAAGARPCTGSILMMVFTLSQGAILAGIASVGAISLGTAITTGLIAAVAVYAKRFAVSLAAGRSRTAERIGRAIELLAAVAVFLLGLAMLAGYITYGGEG